MLVDGDLMLFDFTVILEIWRTPTGPRLYPSGAASRAAALPELRAAEVLFGDVERLMYAG